MHPSATLLYAETLAPGRTHHGDGENFEYDLYLAEVCGERPDGTRLFTERVVIEPARVPVRDAGAMGDHDVYANVVVMTPPDVAERVVELAPAGLDVGGGCAAGTSHLPNGAGLLFKVLGPDASSVRVVVHRFADVTRRAVLGVGLEDLRAWR